MVTHSLAIQRKLALPVYVVHGVEGWLFYFNIGPVYHSQTLGHSMIMQKYRKKLLCLGHSNRQLDVFRNEVDSYGFACLSDDDPFFLSRSSSFK